MYCVRKDPLLVLAAPHSDVRKGQCVSDPCAKLTVRYSLNERASDSTADGVLDKRGNVRRRH